MLSGRQSLFHRKSYELVRLIMFRLVVNNLAI
jgi:hypothetical protein